MSFTEIMPALMGFALGVLLGCFQSPRLRWIAGALVVFLGASATIASGEFRTSWAFLLYDIPLVGMATFAGFVAHTLFQALRRGDTVE
jgi:hypothetical protein